MHIHVTTVSKSSAPLFFFSLASLCIDLASLVLAFRTTLKLEGYEKQLFARLVDRSKVANISEEERADVVRLRDELAATRQGMDICSRAHEHLKDNVSTIDNYATGDAVQFMVSTNEKTIHGKNRGFGWRTRQVGDHISDDSLQQIARSLASITIPRSEPRGSSPPGGTRFVPGVDVEPGKESDSKFKEQYGRGFKLTPHCVPNAPPSGTGSAKAGPSSSLRAGKEGSGGREEERSGGAKEVADAGSMCCGVLVDQAGRRIQVRGRFPLRVGCTVGAGLRW